MSFLMLLGSEIVKRNSMLLFLSQQQQNIFIAPHKWSVMDWIGTLCQQIDCLILQCGSGEQQVQ